MGKHVRGIVLLLILSTSTAWAEGLFGVPVFDTGAIECGVLTTQRWVYPGPRTLEIWKVRHWHGASLNAQLDIHSDVYRVKDHSLLTIWQQDRYANPNGVTHVDELFPVPFVLLPGDQLELRAVCTSSSGIGMAHVTVQLWWTEVP